MDPHYMLAHSRQQSNLTCDILDNHVDDATVTGSLPCLTATTFWSFPASRPACSTSARKPRAGILKLAFVDHKSDMGLFEVVRK